MKNWYKIAKLNKKASISLYISGYQRDDSMDTIFKIGWKLNSMLFEKWLDKQDMAYFKEFSTVPMTDTITMDAHNTEDVTGIINFYTNGIPPQKLEQITNNIVEFLQSKKIKVGQLIRNQSKMYNVPTIRIPIVENPNGEDALIEDRPPEINMANNNAFFMFNTILQYNRDLWEVNRFDPKELKSRIEYYEGETKLQEGSHAGQQAIVFNAPNLSEVLDADMLSGRKALSTYDESKIRRQLARIKEFCEWAIKHGYSEIYVG